MNIFSSFLLDHGILGLLNVTGWLKIFPLPVLFYSHFLFASTPALPPSLATLKWASCVPLLCLWSSDWVLFCAHVLTYPNQNVLQIMFVFIQLSPDAVRGHLNCLEHMLSIASYPEVPPYHPAPLPLWWEATTALCLYPQARLQWISLHLLFYRLNGQSF